MCKKKKQKKSSVNKNIHIGLRKQLKEADAIVAENDVPIDCSRPHSQELPQENFPQVVLLAALDVRKRHGCKREILKQKCLPPKIWSSTCRLFKYGDQSDKENGKDAMKMFILLNNIMCSVTQP